MEKRPCQGVPLEAEAILNLILAATFVKKLSFGCFSYLTSFCKEAVKLYHGVMNFCR
jgi:hypothetical protein